MKGDPRSPGPNGATGEQRTLYVAGLSETRERAAGPRVHGRAPRKAEATSDVTRFRGLLLATGVGAVASLAAVLLLPPPGGLSAPGPLARPHVRAGLACAACHDDAASAPPGSTSSRPVPDTACVRCHGPHASTRAGHARAQSAGTLRCASCHTIHRGDQGVTFAPTGPAIRFAPGTEAEEDGVSFHPPRTTTIALVASATCARCHDLASPSDPAARCVLPGQASLGGARPSVCFDEHQDALAPLLGRRAPPSATGVCAAQHTLDRPLGWEAAREIAALAPVIAPLGGRGGGLAWIGAGLAAAALAFGGLRARDAAARRRKERAEKPRSELLTPVARTHLPTVNVNTCLGCYACVDACPYGVLEIERYVARVVRPEACCGLTLCEQRCPNGSLVVTEGETIGDRPRLTDALESEDSPGVFLAGDVTGLPLIKNAIHQGARAVDRVAASLEDAPRDDAALDLLIVGAGPAGISAALRAKELELRYEVVEQGSVAQSIQSFPRGKLVFDQPLELPVTGKLWLKEATKEELLSQWLRIVRKERLVIHQDTRMVGLDRKGASFRITTEPREGGAPTVRRARRVLLAIGQRGSPRRLPFELDPAVEARVHYHLADARSFEDKRVVIVGLGDVAMEAGLAIAAQRGATVTLVHRGADFTRGKARNVDAVKRQIAAGRIEVLWGAKVGAIAPTEVTVAGAKPRRLPYDAVLVLIGSIPPWDTLRAAGVRTVAEAERDRNGASPVQEADPLAVESA